MNVARAELLPVDPQEAAFSRAKPKRRSRVRKPSRLWPILASAVTWLFACAFLGASVTVAGVFILAGTGWALIAVGLFLFLTAGLLRIGIIHG